MREVTQTVVPEPKVYEPPKCKICERSFVFHRKGGGSQDIWKQSCACDPRKVGCSYTHDPDGTEYANEFYRGEDTGKPIPKYCLFCSAPMQPREDAYFGTMGNYSYCGYAHLTCYQGWVDQREQGKREAEVASQGIAISFWYSLDDANKHAPQTGHYDGQSRLVPDELPDFPAGSVIYENYRRPFAMSHVEIPNLADAEAFWNKATKNDQVAYELHWFGLANKHDKRGKAIKSWTGKGFGRVVGEARRMEWDAMGASGC